MVEVVCFCAGILIMIYPFIEYILRERKGGSGWRRNVCERLAL